MSEAQSQIFQAAVRFLARRNHTRRELLWKLKRKGFAVEEIQAVLDDCEARGYMNDESTGRFMVRHFAQRRYGRLRIQAELQRRGIRDELIEKLLDEETGPGDDVASAKTALEKARSRFEREKDPIKRKAKMYRFLQSRGFDAGAVRQAMDAASERDWRE